jgi:AraC-like DNA-binding protein
MDIIFLFGTVQAFFLALLIFSKKNKSKSDFVLSFWIVFIGLHLLDTYFHTSELVLKYPHLIGIGYNFPILHGPFMFVYVLLMINKEGRFKPVYWLHGIPFLVATLYLMSNYYFLSASEKVAFLHAQMVRLSPDLRVLWIFKVFVGPIYVFCSLIKLKQHSKNIAENFSYSERINLIWLKFVVAGLGFVWIIVLITMFLRFNFPEFPFFMGDYAIYIALTIAVFFLGYFGFKQEVIYTHEPSNHTYSKENRKVENVKSKNDKPQKRYKKSGLDEKTAKEYLKRLLNFMEKEKPYLNGKLSLKEVADSLNISVNHLSQVINEQTSMSFFDFINKYRVEEVKIRLVDPKNEQFTLLAIAFDCGFNSKSSFNSIFKKITELTPSEYAKKNLS